MNVCASQIMKNIIFFLFLFKSVLSQETSFLPTPTTTVDICDGATCFNGGSCVPGPLFYSCNCTAPHQGKHCEYTFENGTIKCGSIAVGSKFFVNELNKTFTKANRSLNTILSEGDFMNNYDFSSVCTTGVETMSWMFSGASQFNQDISHWDTSSVSSMYGMFWAATSFNQSISNWDTSIVSEMAYMFNGATSFNQNLSHWRVPKIPSLPAYFAINSPLKRNTGLHPQWNESTNR